MKHADGTALPDWMKPAESGLEQYCDVLAGPGVEMGLIGPREVPRLWSRHILNCAVVVAPGESLVGPGDRVADVGSGAGLPGIVWAICRPDLTLVLLEPLLRRATFLASVVNDLGLADRVTVQRGRAEDLTGSSDWLPVDVVTARAVAPLGRLLGWTVPLLRPGGRLVALKGSSAADEVAAADAEAQEIGIVDLRVVTCGAGVVDPITTVVTGLRRTAQ